MLIERQEHKLKMICASYNVPTISVRVQAASMKSSTHGGQQGFVLFTFGQQASAALQTVNGIEYASATVPLLFIVFCAAQPFRAILLTL